MHWRIIITAVILFCLTALAACQSQPEAGVETGLKVVATTNLVWDAVKRVGGDQIHASLLVPFGVEAHSFSPSPQDAARLVDADLIFANGAGLEGFLTALIESTGDPLKIVEVSDGIPLRSLDVLPQGAQDEQEGGGKDPHTWMDPNNMMIWVSNIAAALSQADPDHAAYYQQNAQSYQQELTRLDEWIRGEVSQVPEENRELVTDHLIYGYFADRYGFRQVGAIIPGFSSLAQPSAQELAQLEETIRQLNVRAIFVGKSSTPGLAEQVGADAQTRVVLLYTESLTEAGGEASDYIAFMRYDVTAIVDALK